MITQPACEAKLIETYGLPIRIEEKTASAARAWCDGLERTSACRPGAFTLSGALSPAQVDEAIAYYLHPDTVIYGYRDKAGRFLSAAACNITSHDDECIPANHLYVRFLYCPPDAPPKLGRCALGGVLLAAASDNLCDGVVLCVRPDNRGAAGLYQSLGFDKHIFIDQLDDVMHLPKERVLPALGELALQL